MSNHKGTIGTSLAVAAVALALAGCTTDAAPDAPSWCPSASDLQDSTEPDLGGWVYDETGFHECRFLASDDNGERGARFIVMQHGDDWWETISVHPHGMFEFDRTLWVSEDMLLAWPGPDREAQRRRDLAVPDAHWMIDFSGSYGGGACELLLDAYDDLGESNR